MSRFEAGGTLAPTLTDMLGTAPAYHSVAGQPAQALAGGVIGPREPLTLLDFIDDRIRGIDAERNRLSMLREQVTSSGLVISVDDIRRVLG